MKKKHVAAIGLLAYTLLANSSDAQIGKRFPSEKQTIVDSVTGYPVTVLTHGPASNAKIYQTHPQWTADGKHVIFRTAGRSTGAQAYAVDEATGEIVQVTDGPGNNTSSLNVARKSMRLFFLRTPGMEAAVPGGAPARPATMPAEAPATMPTTLPTSMAAGTPSADAATRPSTAPTGPTMVMEIDLARVLADSRAGNMKPAAEYERVCATLPDGMRESGGFGIDADEKIAYVGVRGGDVGKHLPPGVQVMPKPEGARMGAGPGGLRSIDLATGEIKVVIDTPFQMGHVQTNPFVPGEIIYCHETGGDGTQRMYTVKSDGTGNRPLYVEAPYDWVTHETVVTKDEVMFNLIGHQSRLRKHPTGIAVVNLRTDAVQILGQIDERQPDTNNLGVNAAGRDSYGGFWHCNGSADGRWAVGDTFGGNLWLIERATGKMTLLTTDHKMKPDHLHPTFDDASTKILVQSGKMSDGKRLDLMVVPIPPELLVAKK